jgi:hypothetical protein
MRLAHSPVTLSEAKGLNRQILRSAQNDNAERLHCKVYECHAFWFSGGFEEEDHAKEVVGARHAVPLRRPSALPNLAVKNY